MVSTNALALERRIMGQIPLLSAMKIQFERCNDERIIIRAPLSDNVNDKGTAFGGSIVTLATITGWCFTTLLADKIGDNEVVIADSSTRYLLPIKGDFEAHCRLADESLIETFLAKLKERGRARLDLEVLVYHDGQLAATYQGSYVSRLKPVEQVA